jgi:hypothetical protein
MCDAQYYYHVFERPILFWSSASTRSNIMSTGGNISATSFVNTSHNNELIVVALGPPNPGLDPSHKFPEGFEYHQTSLWWTEGTSLAWREWFAGNHYPIDPEWAVALAAPPCVISWGGDRLDFFVAGADGSLWHLWRDDNGTWGDWEFLSVPGKPPHLTTIKSTPVAISTSPGVLNVFVLGADGHIWGITFADNSWTSWFDLGEPPTTERGFASGPAVMILDSNVIEIFALGNDGNIWNFEFAGASTWTGHPAPSSVTFTGPPTVAACGPAQFVLIARATDGSLWCKTFLPPIPAQISNTGPPAHPGASHWSSGFVPIVSGDTVASTPAALAGGPNVIDVFAVNYANNLIHVHMNWVSEPSIPSGPPFVRYYDPDWSGVEVIAASTVLAVAPPCPVSWGGKRLDVFAVDPTGTVHHFWWTGSAWSAEAMPGVVVQQP